MDEVKRFQKKLIEKARPLSPAVEEAFYKYPRHLFVPEYSLAAAYSDHPLMIFDKYPYVSTISQPTFVLKILELLQLEPGQKVFELGAGSGWNTALMAHLVGDKGEVISSEVIPEVAERARQILRTLNVNNARVLSQDGFEGNEAKAPYDRAIFTAGSREFPEQLFSQLKEGAIMVFVRQRDMASDVLEVLRKEGKQWRLLSSTPCSFVSVIRPKKETRTDGGSLSW